MNEKIFSFTISPTLEAEFAKAASNVDRSGAEILREYMRDFVRRQAKAREHDVWFCAQAQKGFEAAEAGRLAGDDEVEARFAERRAQTLGRLAAPE